MRIGGRWLVDIFVCVVGMPLLLAGGLVALVPINRRRPPQKPRILWGSRPIKSLVYMARAARQAGFDGDVAVRELSPIFSTESFDHIVFRRARLLPLARFLDGLTASWFLARSLCRYDSFNYYLDGGILRNTVLRRFEVPYLKALGKKVVLIPYGSDAWSSDLISNLRWRAALMIDDPMLGRNAAAVQQQLRQGARYADCMLGCLVHISCLPRWDILPLTCYPVDTDALRPVAPKTTGTVRIAHSANHRGFKGSDFLVDAVARLQADGFDVELDIIERAPNQEALERMAQADVYVDQLVAGYALAALEAMALGKVVISPIDSAEAQVFRRYSYLDECPIVSAQPETIESVLRELIERRGQWPEIGRKSREFCERRHSFAAAAEMWTAIYDRIWEGRNVDLINFYHPLEGVRNR